MRRCRCMTLRWAAFDCATAMCEPVMTDSERHRKIGKRRAWLMRSGVKESGTHSYSQWSVCMPWFGFYPVCSFTVLCCAVLCCAVLCVSLYCMYDEEGRTRHIAFSWPYWVYWLSFTRVFARSLWWWRRDGSRGYGMYCMAGLVRDWILELLDRK